MPLPLLIPGLIAGAGAIGKFITGLGQKKEAKKINPVFNQYKTSPYATNKLGIAQQLFNGRMAGAPQLEKNIFSSQANTLDAVGRNATDASQALAIAAGSQGQTNEALSDLQIKEAQNKQMMLQNLNQAYGTMIGEGDKEYDSMLQKYEMDVARKSGLLNSGQLNKAGGVNDLAALGIDFASIGAGGGFGMRKIKRPNNTPADLVPNNRPTLGGLLPRRTPNFN